MHHGGSATVVLGELSTLQMEWGRGRASGSVEGGERESERDREREGGRLMTGIHKATFPLISHFDSHTQVRLRVRKRMDGELIDQTVLRHEVDRFCVLPDAAK